ncbi:MAG: glycosyltransferase [Ammonifex sp.]|nr:MAG: glycosyltransferase [Ammonifex sp.]
MVSAEKNRVNQSGVSTAERHLRPFGLTSIVILAWNELPYTRMCIESIQQYTDCPYELILVDNGSTDGTGEYFDSIPNATGIKNPVNLGFAAGCNQGIRAARGDYILLLNNDTVVSHNWLSNLVNCLESSPEIGIVGPVSNCVSGVQLIATNYHSLEEMHRFARDFNRPDRSRWFDTERLVGFCMLIRRSVIERIGLLDESFGIGNFEDDDYCRRALQSGFRLVCTGDTFVHHFGNKTFVGNNVDMAGLLAENRIKFCKKWNIDIDCEENLIELKLKEGLDSTLKLRARLACEDIVTRGKTIGEKLLASRERLLQTKITKDSLTITYLAINTHVTGGVKIFLEQANRLAARGHKVYVVSYYNPPEWFPLQAEFIQVPLRSSLSDYVPGSDIVIATFWTQIPELCTLAERSFVTHLVQGDSCLFERDKLPEHQRTLMDQLYAQPIDLIVISQHLQQVIRDTYGRESHYVPNAIDHQVFFPRPRSPRDKKRILVIGADLLPFKGIQDIAVALECLSRKGVEFNVTWITPAPPQTVRPAWEIVANPTQEELARIMADCDIYVSGSHYEAFSLPPLEAMASGVAVVTTANQGVTEYARNEYNCLMVPVREPDALSEAIYRLIGDERLCAELVANGLVTAQGYTWDRATNRLEEVLRTIIREPSLDKSSEVNVVDADSFKANEQSIISGYFHYSRPELVELVPLQAKKVLDIGCAAGMMSAALKERGVEEVVGVEINAAAAQEAAARLDRVLVGDIEKLDLPYPEKYFDAVVMGDVLEHLRDPWVVLARLQNYLAEEGTVIASIPNVANISIIMGLINGEWHYANAGILDRTHLRFFTLDGIREMFANTGYRVVSVDRIKDELTEREQKLVDLLQSSEMAPPSFAEEASVVQYLVVARKKSAAQKVSLCTVVKNEAEYLSRCLSSAKKAADEIIVVDTGSSDETVRIAGSFGAKIYHLTGAEDAGAAWKFAFEKATGDWIIFLETDEELVDGDGPKLRSLLSRGDADGYYLREVNYIGKEPGLDAVVGAAFRVFRNDPRYFKIAAPEHIVASIQAQDAKIILSDVRINHCGCLNRSSRDKKKIKDDLAILEEEVVKRPDDKFTRFNLGVKYMCLEQHDKALKEFQSAFKNIALNEAAHAPALVRNIALCLKELKRFREALQVLDDAVLVYPDYIDLLFLVGCVYVELKDCSAAAKAYQECIKKGEADKCWTSQPGVGSYRAWFGLGRSYERIGYWEGAVQAYTNALKGNEFLEGPVYGLGRILIGREDDAGVKAFFERHLDTDDSEALSVLGGVFSVHQRYEDALYYAERAVSQNPSLPKALLVKGEALSGVGRLAEAIDCFTGIRKKSEYFFAAQLNQAFCLLLLSDFPGAAAVLSVVEENPHWRVHAQIYRRFTALLTGDHTDVTLASITEDPELYAKIVLDILGKLLDFREFEKFEQSLLLFDILPPEERHLKLGTIYFGRGFKESAAEELIEAIRLGVQDARAFGMLGEISAEKGFLEDAVIFYQHAIGLDDQYLPFHTGLAGVLAQLGQYEEARAILNQVLQKFPESVLSQTMLKEIDQRLVPERCSKKNVASQR